MEAVAERSRRLCRADGSRVWLLHGDHLRSMTSYKFVDGGSESGRDEVLPLKSTSVVGRAFVDRRTVHVADVATLVDSDYPDTRVLYERYGFRTVLGVPMLREGVSIGTIGVLRKQVQPFSAAEIRLVEIFAAGCDRHRERASVQRDRGGARTPDRHRRDPARDQRLAHQCAAGARYGGRALGCAVPCRGQPVWLLQGGQLCAMTSYGSIYRDDAREALPVDAARWSRVHSPTVSWCTCTTCSR
jgi:GAF domain-containing protein